MPTFEEPSVDADEAQQALRALAHATRSFTDTGDIYSTLGSLSQAAAASMGQSVLNGAVVDGAHLIHADANG
jgi:hypothetical protein